jgi:hypothetical protein
MGVLALSKLAIVGSRGFTDYETFCIFISDYITKEVDTIVSGGARGADYLAKKYAKEHQLKYIEIPAQWDKYGKSAGYRRNAAIVNLSDFVVAFWDGQSRGTKHTIDLSNKSGKPLEIIYINRG